MAAGASGVGWHPAAPRRAVSRLGRRRARSRGRCAVPAPDVVVVCAFVFTRGPRRRSASPPVAKDDGSEYGVRRYDSGVRERLTCRGTRAKTDDLRPDRVVRGHLPGVPRLGNRRGWTRTSRTTTPRTTIPRSGIGPDTGFLDRCGAQWRGEHRQGSGVRAPSAARCAGPG